MYNFDYKYKIFIKRTSNQKNFEYILRNQWKKTSYSTSKMPINNRNQKLE